MPEPEYSKIHQLVERIHLFNTERNWSQFHNPKDLAISLTLEAAEVLEHFQWKNPDEMEKHLAENKDKVGDELADVFYWTLLMCEYFDINLVQALEKKLGENEAKYPVSKSKDNHIKYTQL